MRKLSLLSSCFLVLACCVSGAAHAQVPDTSAVSDTFILLSGNNVVERLLITENQEGANGVFKTFNTLFMPGSAVQGGIVTGPGEGATNVSDTAEFIVDPANANARLLRVFSDGDPFPPRVPDPGEVKSFVLFNFLGNAMPADRIVIYSGVSVPVPEPETYAMMIGGLGLLGWAVRRRNHMAG